MTLIIPTNRNPFVDHKHSCAKCQLVPKGPPCPVGKSLLAAMAQQNPPLLLKFWTSQVKALKIKEIGKP